MAETKVFKEAGISQVSDGTYVVKDNGGTVVTAQNFGQVVKRLRAFFDEEIVKLKSDE